MQISDTGEHQPEPLWMCQGEVQVALSDGHLSGGVVVSGESFGHGGLQQVVALRGQGDQECVSIGEVMAGCRVRHPQRSGQATKRDGVGALALQNVPGSQQQLPTQITVVVPVRHGSRSHTNLTVTSLRDMLILSLSS